MFDGRSAGNHVALEDVSKIQERPAQCHRTGPVILEEETDRQALPFARACGTTAGSPSQVKGSRPASIAEPAKPAGFHSGE